MTMDGWDQRTVDGLESEQAGDVRPVQLPARPSSGCRSPKAYFRNHRAAVMALMFDCPFEPNPVDCPAHHIRRLELAKRVAWVRGLTDAVCQQLYLQHLECLAIKESRLPVASAGGPA